MAKEKTKEKSAELVTLKINDKLVEAGEGMTVLEAARSADIFIPTLCYLENLPNLSACQLCIVEVVKGNRSRIVVSCQFPVSEGLVVYTESERVVKHRKVILELLLTRWPWVNKELLEKYGIKESRFDENTTFCILCGLCVQHCALVKKANVLNFVGRGTEKQVVFHSELALMHCPTCKDGEMECRFVCPTGVIPKEFAVTIPRFGKKLPVVFPVNMYSDDNIQEISKKVGDI